MVFTRFDGIPAIYRHVAALPEAVLVEFPFPQPVVIQDNGPYVFASTVHFRPMLNGYSGFTPASYYLHAAVAQRFPSAESLREFGLLGATHIVVHGARLGAGVDRAVGGERRGHAARPRRQRSALRARPGGAVTWRRQAGGAGRRCRAGGVPHLAAGPRRGGPVAARQRRHRADHLDRVVGGPPAAAGSRGACSTRRSSIPSGARSPTPSRCWRRARWRFHSAPPACRPPPPTTCWPWPASR